jgi:hypothetical protein
MRGFMSLPLASVAVYGCFRDAVVTEVDAGFRDRMGILLCRCRQGKAIYNQQQADK